VIPGRRELGLKLPADEIQQLNDFWRTAIAALQPMIDERLPLLNGT